MAELLIECAKMSTFNNPNVLTVKGVCLDGGPLPYIIMPYMANGSLLSFLKKERSNLVLTKNADSTQVYYYIAYNFLYPLKSSKFSCFSLRSG